MSFLKKLFGPGGSHACKEVVLVEHEKAKSRQHVLDKLKEIETLGGEGLMLRKPESFVPSLSDPLVQTPGLTRLIREYQGGRSASLLKIKVHSPWLRVPFRIIPLSSTAFRTDILRR
jgi:hypothetical protein